MQRILFLQSMVIPARQTYFRSRGYKKISLQDLGFVENAEVTVVSQFDGNLIVNIKDSRVAVNKEMARHIMV